jgi:anti-sigma B factor antagonist
VQLTIDYDRSGGDRVVVRLCGEVDIAVEEQLRKSLDEVLAVWPPPAQILVDLGGLRFMDCSGVRVLLQVHRNARTMNCALMVCRPGPLVEHVLTVSGVADVLGLEEDCSTNW